MSIKNATIEYIKRCNAKGVCYSCGDIMFDDTVSKFGICDHCWIKDSWLKDYNVKRTTKNTVNKNK